ncbi:hypothetical protein J7434_21125, partial [Xanthomonas phaseoli pv. dieffenbachiae]|uniref:hypothetical protein n=1 Tax=Xanthomonas phaseoli TaxID=1985254 RepID=UPI001ADC8FBD
GNDLAVGEAGCLHGTSSEKGTRKFHFWRQLTCGGITASGKESLSTTKTSGQERSFELAPHLRASTC